MKSSWLAALRSVSHRLSHWLVGSVVISVVGVVGAIHFWKPQPAAVVQVIATQPTQWVEPIQPIEAIPGLDPRKISLGQKLFNDPRLSDTNQVSCSTCHNLKTGGTDRRAVSMGIHGGVGVINAPTVFNSGFNFRQFWDGRASTLEKQMDEPIQLNTEMGSTWPEVVGKLKSSPDYVQAFRRIYASPITLDYVKDSVAQFERSLTTPNSRFDRYLRHEPNALTGQEEQGYQLFKSLGCTSCHQGMNVGGNMYQKLGVMADYFTDRGHLTRADRGRFNVTGDPRDLYMFKVPSLRNVALTAPYFHDGGAATLPDAVRMMGKYELGRALTDQEIALIVGFLKTLTGELNGQPL